MSKGPYGHLSAAWKPASPYLSTCPERRFINVLLDGHFLYAKSLLSPVAVYVNDFSHGFEVPG